MIKTKWNIEAVKAYETGQGVELVNEPYPHYVPKTLEHKGTRMTKEEALKLEREMKQLRELHAVQGRDGCWDIDDYMLGMFNGLELALCIMESRPPQYKERKALAQPDQEPVAWRRKRFSPELGEYFEYKRKIFSKETDGEDWTPLYRTPPQRKPLPYEQLDSLWQTTDTGDFELDIREFARAIEAAHGIKEKK